MKTVKLFGLAVVGLFSFTSCAHPVRHQAKDYYLALPWREDQHFNILQLSDLHISNESDREKHLNFVRQTVELAKAKKDAIGEQIDLIVITGDIFTFADKQTVYDTFSFFDSLQIPWAPTWGNHDEQCYFSVDWLTGYLNDLNTLRLAEQSTRSSYCVFQDLQDDDVFGNANYVINLYHQEDYDKRDWSSPMEEIFIFDSNRYNYGEYFGYDYIHSDQVDWYERMVHNTEYVLGNQIFYVPSLAFFHIPFPEFEEAYQKIQTGQPDGCKWSEDLSGITRNRHDSPTSTGDPKKNTHLFDKMRHFNTQGVFVGHNHASNYSVDVPYTAKFKDSESGHNDISLCFGIKATERIYCEYDLLGGQIISLDPDYQTFTLESILHNYNQGEGK